MIKKTILTCFILVLTTSLSAQKNKKDLDRRAIKEMCGCYEIEFRYSETFSPNVNYIKSKDYKTAALEWAELIVDKNNEISIQHLLVINDSMVIKHWRQDWEYESEKTINYVADNTWDVNKISKEEVKGKWTQKVFQVDDSPRYTGTASWVHVDGKRYWENTTDAPLPRREYSKRSDYNIMSRGNRIHIKEGGWLHEQDNQKIIRDSAEGDVVLASEKGYNTYNKIADEKCSAAIQWWKENHIKWTKVRQEWGKFYTVSQRLKFKSKVDGKRLYQHLFSLEVNTNNTKIREIINKFLN
jgi:hypothetical protein